MRSINHLWLRPILAFGIGGAIQMGALAETPPDCTTTIDVQTLVTLSAAVDSALCRDTRTAAAWVSIKAQKIQLAAAKAAYLPTVNASLTAQSNTSQNAQSPGGNQRVTGYSSYLGLSWRLFDFGERAAREEMAERLLTAATSTYDDAVRRTVSDTIQAYFSALQASATLGARQQSVALAQRTRDAARDREQKGAASRADTLQAEASMARARLNLQRAKAELDKATAVLVQTMGVPAGTALRLPDKSPTPSRADLPDLGQLLDEARAHHPAILAARYQRDASQAGVAAARAAGRPTIDFTAANYRNGYPNQSVQASRSSTFTVGATITIPLFDGDSRRNKIQEAQAQAEKSELQVTDTENRVLLELVKTHAELAASLDNIDAANQLLQAAQSAMDSATNRYERGVSDILELISAQGTLVDALDARAQCEYQWNAARLKLMSDLGEMNRDGIAALDGPLPPR